VSCYFYDAAGERTVKISSESERWLRINEFSVEPSIFKFAAEALEFHRTEMYANGYEFVKK